MIQKIAFQGVTSRCYKLWKHSQWCHVLHVIAPNLSFPPCFNPSPLLWFCYAHVWPLYWKTLYKNVQMLSDVNIFWNILYNILWKIFNNIDCFTERKMLIQHNWSTFQFMLLWFSQINITTTNYMYKALWWVSEDVQKSTRHVN